MFQTLSPHLMVLHLSASFFRDSAGNIQEYREESLWGPLERWNAVDLPSVTQRGAGERKGTETVSCINLVCLSLNFPSSFPSDIPARTELPSEQLFFVYSVFILAMFCQPHKCPNIFAGFGWIWRFLL